MTRQSQVFSTVAMLTGLLLVVSLAFIALQRADWISSSPTENTSFAALQVPELPSPVATAPGTSLPPRTPYPTMPGGAPTPPNLFPTYVIPRVTPLTIGAPDPGFDPPTPDPYTPRTPTPTHLPTDPLRSILFAERVSDIRDSTKAAGVIVTCTVRKVGPSRWSTPDGNRPANPWAEGNQDFIFTPITVTVDSYIKGLLPQTELRLHGYGGTVGQDSMGWGDDLYNFIEGDRVLLFIFRGQGVNPSTVSNLNLWDVYDRFSITADGQAVNMYHEMPLQQLLDQISAILTESTPTLP